MLEQYRHIHFIGIGGAGMSALAYVLVKRGYDVTGSDLHAGHMAEQLAEANAMVFMGHDASQVDGADAVVVSSAIHPDNVELAAAKAKGIPVLHRSDVLKELLNKEGARGVAVAGAHGKTTTSAMISVIAAEAGLDPTVVIGGDVQSLGGNARDGKSPWVVAESDESDGSFLKFHPYLPVITNIEDDHLDHYGTEENIYQAFKQFLGDMKEGGTGVLCMDNPKVRRLAQETDRPFVTYGLTEDCDYYARNIRHTHDGNSYDLYHHGEKLGTIRLRIPGRHNVLDSLGATSAALLMGVPFESLRDSLERFAGAKRRFETKGRCRGIWVVDDYAHHPAELKASILSVKELYAGRKVTGIFQPHLYTRTRDFAADFAASLSLLDELILLDIYPAREEPIPGVTSQIIFDAVTIADKRLIRKEELLDVVAAEAGNLEVVLMVGAGNIELLVDPVKQILDKKE